MSTRLARTIALVAICGCGFLSRATAQQNPSLPQNFRLSQMAYGPGRSQATMTLQWEQAVTPGTRVPYTKYQLTAGCSYTASGQDQLSGGSNSMVLTGPGPTYIVRAICSCLHGVTGPAVRVAGVNKAPYVFINPGKWVMCPGPPPP